MSANLTHCGKQSGGICKRHLHSRLIGSAFDRWQHAEKFIVRDATSAIP